VTDVCPAIPPAAGFISSMTGYIDCQAQILGSGAWGALAAPGSTLAVVLTGFLTIFIALIGYNLLLGRTMTVRGGTLAFVKIGAVFALATSWPAYRTLVYELVTEGPSELVAEIGPQAGVVGSDGTLTQRLDGVDAAMAQLAVLGAGPLPPDLQDSTGAYIPPPPFAGFNAFALGALEVCSKVGSAFLPAQVWLRSEFPSRLGWSSRFSSRGSAMSSRTVWPTKRCLAFRPSFS
jgi:type IV secretion system protein VirB6